MAFCEQTEPILKRESLKQYFILLHYLPMFIKFNNSRTPAVKYSKFSHMKWIVNETDIILYIFLFIRSAGIITLRPLWTLPLNILPEFINKRVYYMLYFLLFLKDIQYILIYMLNFRWMIESVPKWLEKQNFFWHWWDSFVERSNASISDS